MECRGEGLGRLAANWPAELWLAVLPKAGIVLEPGRGRLSELRPKSHRNRARGTQIRWPPQRGTVRVVRQ